MACLRRVNLVECHLLNSPACSHRLNPVECHRRSSRACSPRDTLLACLHLERLVQCRHRRHPLLLRLNQLPRGNNCSGRLSKDSLVYLKWRALEECNSHSNRRWRPLVGCIKICLQQQPTSNRRTKCPVQLRNRRPRLLRVIVLDLWAFQVLVLWVVFPVLEHRLLLEACLLPECPRLP